MLKRIRFYLLLLACLGLATSALGQQVVVSGTVTNAQTNEPLVGANILVRGTSIGTATNAKGEYQLEVPSLQDTLIFSFIGFQSQIVPINGRNVINLEMQTQAISVKELVVVGYQKKRKGALTGSVTQVEGEVIAQAPTVNVTKSLQGKVSGLIINNRGGQPGSPNLNILIRGQETFGESSPLYIIDGVPSTEVEFANLLPQNIASVSVLKDASAAIYGARAANGVIVVTTKRGREGASNITVNASTGVTTFTVIPKMMNAYQYAVYRNEMETRYGRVKTYTQKDIELYKNGSKPLTHPSTDWYAATIEEYAPQRQISISGSGGTEDVQYFVSGGYFNKGSLFRGNDMYFRKYQLRSNIDAQITNDLQIMFDMSGVLRRIHQPAMPASDLFHRVFLSLPTETAFYPNRLPGLGAVNANPAIIATNRAGWFNAKRKAFNARFSANLDLSWLTKGLSLRGIAALDYHIDNSKRFANTWAAYLYNPQTGEYEQKLGKLNESQSFSDLSQLNAVRRQRFFNLSLRYERNFGDHNINAFVAYEIQDEHFNNLSGYRRDLISEQKVYLDLASTNNQTTGGTALNSGRISYFGSLGYNYKRKYMVTFTLRHDGSFNFPKQGRFGTFPSISAGWRISDEPFMASTKDWLNSLKIRASYGVMGSDQVPSFQEVIESGQIPFFQYLAKYVLSSGTGYWVFGEDPARHNGFYVTNTPNPAITWEISKEFDIGLDAVLFNNHLSLTFDYFQTKRRDILIQRTGGVPEYTGLSLPQQNLGKINNHGIEFSFKYQNNIMDDWAYHFSGNFSYYKNEIIYMSEPKDIPSYQSRTGHPINSYLLYKADGIFNTQQELDNTDATLPGTKPGDIKYIDVNGDGNITGLDKVRIYASDIPKIQFGFTAGFSYKNVALSLFFQGQALAKNYMSPNRGALSNEPAFYFTKRWTKDNKDATYPRAMDRTDFYNYSHSSTFWLYNATFVRLKNLTLSYTLPVKWLESTSFSNIRIYLKGSNLWFWDKMSDRMGGKYYDPEMVGGEGKYYPQQSIYMAGISIQI